MFSCWIDVKVNLEDNTLTISGEKKSIHREGDENSKASEIRKFMNVYKARCTIAVQFNAKI